MGLKEVIRPAAVAGLFYPGAAAELRRELDGMLAGVPPDNSLPGTIKALIVPHAGYIYSGPVAARAYALLKPQRDRIRRVVLLGPAHRVAIHGLALPEDPSFQTPLGTVPIDPAAAGLLQDLRQVTINRAVHAQEHSLEVQLPFLQHLLGEFTLIPLAVGDASATEVAEVLERLWGGPETLIIVSSDLSHFLTYEQARHTDLDTCRAIQARHDNLNHEQACGGTPINGLTQAARRHRLSPHLLDLRNSGDTAGDRDRVVGYAAFAFTGEPAHVQ